MQSRYGPWEKLRAVRERGGTSSANLARAVGISRQQMSNLENGHRWPSIITTRALAQALGVPVDAIERRIGELASS